MKVREMVSICRAVDHAWNAVPLEQRAELLRSRIWAAVELAFVAGHAEATRQASEVLREMRMRVRDGVN